MLYAVSIETSRPIRHGRMRRRERVYVDAPDGDVARLLALQRFRHLERPVRVRLTGLHRIELGPPGDAPAMPPEPEQRTAPKHAKSRRRRRRSKP